MKKETVDLTLQLILRPSRPSLDVIGWTALVNVEELTQSSVPLLPVLIAQPVAEDLIRALFALGVANSADDGDPLPIEPLVVFAGAGAPLPPALAVPALLF